MALIEGQLNADRSLWGRGFVESRDSHSLSDPATDLPNETALSGAETSQDRLRFVRTRQWLKKRLASVWAPVVLRAAAVLLGMLTLASIGAFATAKGLSGHSVLPAHAASSGAEAPRLEQGALGPALGPSPRKPPAAPISATAANPVTRSAGVTEDGKVILNLATAEDLQRLPGVGKKRAEAILALRDKLGGRFRRMADLLRIRGIGPKRLKQIQPMLLLDPPTAAAEERPLGTASSARSDSNATERDGPQPR